MDAGSLVERALDIVPGALQRWVRGSEPYHTTIAFAAGFGYDSATLRRIDQLLDNLLLLIYLVVLGVLLVMDLRLRHGRAPVPWEGLSNLLRRRERVVHLAIQFLFGGLFSAYVIFYLKSATMGRSLVFIASLVALLVVNEYRSRQLRIERIQLALYCFCVFSFLLYFIPVTTGWMGWWTALLAALGALGAAGTVAWLSDRVPGIPLDAPVKRRLATNGAVWIGMLSGLAALHVAGWIPPVPLSLVHGGVYHEVVREGEHFELHYPRPGFGRFWIQESDPFVGWPDSAVHCFTAIFAPHGMQLQVSHRWERWNEARETWVLQDDIPFEVRGGRAGGFRGTTRKKHHTPGRWRVRVVADDGTEDGREIGRVPFDVVSAAGPAPERWRSVDYR